MLLLSYIRWYALDILYTTVLIAEIEGLRWPAAGEEALRHLWFGLPVFKRCGNSLRRFYSMVELQYSIIVQQSVAVHASSAASVRRYLYVLSYHTTTVVLQQERR